MKKIGIVICCYNEFENIPTVYEAVTNTIAKLSNYHWDILFTDNCSTDGSDKLLRELAAKDSRVKVILNQANFGGTRSVMNAMFALNTDATILMASDMEEPPELIPQFLSSWKEGYKVVLGQYKSREEGLLIHLFRQLYYKIVLALSETNLEKNITGFGLLDSSVVKEIRTLDELNPQLRYIFAELGYEIKYIPFHKPHRKKGKSSFSLFGYYIEFVNSVIATSQIPIHFVSLLGLSVSSIGFLLVLICFFVEFVLSKTFDWGIMAVLIAVLFLGGLQIFSIGIIGEYVGTVLKKVVKRPYVIERERINFDNSEMTE